MYIKSLLLINKDRRRFEIRYIPYILRNFTHVNPNFYLSTFRVEYFRLNFVVLITFQYNSDTKFITKMGRTLLPKFPRECWWNWPQDEIDDDEENALNVTGPFSGNRNAPPKSSTPTTTSGVAPPPASTEEVISLLLQQQAPLAPPAAHQSAVVTTANSASAPLDFSTSDHSRYRDNYK